jgi:hypothetical protein
MGIHLIQDDFHMDAELIITGEQTMFLWLTILEIAKVLERVFLIDGENANGRCISSCFLAKLDQGIRELMKIRDHPASD